MTPVSHPLWTSSAYMQHENRGAGLRSRALGLGSPAMSNNANDEVLEAAGVAAFLIAKAVDALFGSLPKGTDPETIIKALSLHLMAYAEGQSSVRFLSDALLARQALREMGVNVAKTRN